MLLRDVSHARYLDRKVNRKKLNFWDDTIWCYFRRRTYPRNINKRVAIDGQLFLYFIAVLSIASVIYLPFKYFMVLFFLATNGCALIVPIRDAYESRWFIWLNVLVGAVGLLTHWQFGLEIFGFHLEHYLFWAYLGSGVLSVYRRFWNYWIWWKLDSIVIKARWG